MKSRLSRVGGNRLGGVRRSRGFNQPVGALLFIGVPRKLILRKRRGLVRPSFWDANAPHLDDLLRLARVAYLARVKQAHPDKGGSAEECRLLNAAWRAVHRSFARRGVTLN